MSTLSKLVTHRRSRAPDPNDAPARYVYFMGPEEEVNAKGVKSLVWSVFIGDDHELPTGQVYACGSYEAGMSLTLRMAKQRKLELVVGATLK